MSEWKLAAEHVAFERSAEPPEVLRPLLVRGLYRMTSYVILSDPAPRAAYALPFSDESFETAPRDCAVVGSGFLRSRWPPTPSTREISRWLRFSSSSRRISRVLRTDSRSVASIVC